ncbi:ubiquinone/menaquinone biosynthesis C-methylase UbiE [Dyadobacter sp. BE34]|uniref:Ubiquinone/menaquinone biosynthesis C-methylase UbiE n=1 Tax=Dyadobacter fermentans TaxID=94254 RepID=A0ABU1QZW4_9BACT|nr:MULTISPECIES: methyltransferase domain-containing protein [Dyadobacter]MDR6806199.1 ubiquinone/menaquinone biosynthesis C-methylase UbiE [Dyadobacter fermentans]MDR7043940.1 ubiquinone/menaquinone biosynthesis C-methylase UbiE [Dyadobacter sp. BE242]MDR7198251.1 ubiquinone/menaquinone biosynthesis C-methylase UbiE [Dyadobacter sp. BE34]MDR7216214.1 ubiquinone/menaquinone biosynthesis C-methylase UbiE [Dyadobacter sp. BE31]MDR7264260.1 ubiquinone/menaquinone biosynthesis C-methylase UbiE [Dy
MQLSDNIKDSYSNQYDENSVKWRNTGARYKALNIVELSKSIRFKNVLEVGAGEGSILSWLSQWNFCDDLNCIEISESGIELIKSKNIKNLKSILLFDGYKIPYPDNHFDLVICSHVLEHVEHERILLREIKRVSKHQIFEVPIDFSFYVDRKLDHFLSYGHINIYTPSLFRFLLKSENFEVIRDINYLYDDEVLQLMFKKKNSAYYITKIKFAILSMVPYLRGIKPSSYAVLTQKTEKQLSIF